MKSNVLTRARKSKANELTRLGRLTEACDLYLKVCRLDPGDVESRLRLSEIERRLDRAPDAEASARQALLLQPQLPLAWLTLGLALGAQGKMVDEVAAYRRAVDLQPGNADAQFLLGGALLRTGGSSADAAAAYRAVLRQRPNDVDAMSNLASVLVARGGTDEACALAERVALLRPKDDALLCDMANVLQLGGRMAAAHEIYDRVLTVSPHSMKALGSLAELQEKTGQTAAAEQTAERALRLQPHDPRASLAAARAARRQGRVGDGIARLEPLLAQTLRPDDAGAVRLLLGQLHDEAGDARRAFPLFVEGKRFVAQATLGNADQQARFVRESMDSMRRFAECNLHFSVPNDETPVAGAPIFMIGFPRSGTTLLEQILDSHPDLQTLEERGTVAAMVDAFLGMSGGDVDALARLDRDQLSALRTAYFAEVARHLTLHPGARLVDKMPLNTIYVPLIWRVFPNAKFILSIRHPCDVCLSCLMQHFAVNEGMAGFFTLEGAAEVYGMVMGNWRRFVGDLPLDHCRIRYEDVVADFDGEMHRLFAFLGIGWDDAVLDHVEHARRRGRINTPSYHQVTQPIHRRSVYRWQRYKSEFANVMPVLAPFVEHFGYETPRI